VNAQLLFVLLHRPGPTWDANLPYPQQPGVEDHVAYMKTCFEQGRILMGGPFADDSGGMMLLEAGDLQEATNIARADPKVRDGLLVVQVHPWRVVFE
jgi:uncharacterized protein YciI